MKVTAENFTPSEAVSVSLGVAIGGYIRLWQDGEPTLWQIRRRSDFDEYERVLCSGAVSTDRYAGGCGREVASFDSRNSVMCVGITTSFFHDGGMTLGRGMFVKLTPADAAKAARVASWHAVEEFILRAAQGARARGEVVVVGPGPNPSVDGRAVLLGTATDRARTLSIVSASPSPRGAGWDRVESTTGRVTLIAPVSEDARIEAASLTVTALREWGVEPFDVGIAFLVPIDHLTRQAG